MEKIKIEKILGRKEYESLIKYTHPALQGKRILITGANGSIGTHLVKRLTEIGTDFLPTDIEGNMTYMDITNPENVKSVMKIYDPEIIVNIAGAKHAPEGEHETWKTLSINTIGTKNLIDYSKPDTKIILTSTCKSCNPETVYGSSKLIAERMIMNIDGTVVRFFNVIETQGNVFEIWENVDDNNPIKVVAACKRHFISLSEATGLILFSIVQTLYNNNGRYIVNSPILREMGDIANSIYPNKEKTIIIPRRGDRVEEKFHGTHENIQEYLLDNSVIKLKNSHDK